MCDELYVVESQLYYWVVIMLSLLQHSSTTKGLPVDAGRNTVLSRVIDNRSDNHPDYRRIPLFYFSLDSADGGEVLRHSSSPVGRTCIRVEYFEFEMPAVRHGEGSGGQLDRYR